MALSHSAAVSLGIMVFRLWEQPASLRALDFIAGACSQQSSKERIQAMETRCYRKILRISYKDRVTDEEVRAKIEQAIGPH